MVTNKDNILADKAKDTLHSAPSLELPDPRSLSNRNEKKASFKTGGLMGAGIGLGLGIALLAGARLLDIPLGSAESVFIVAQFSLLGGLMTYINS